MNWYTSASQFLDQVTEAQRQFFQGATSNIPGMSGFNNESMRKNLDDSLSFQEKIVNDTLAFQENLARLTLETQKQFWQNYFSMLRNK
ncbi:MULTISPECIES: hypothetical protein [unclassified Leptolyngbya]|uniref:hypothetical protein n=1 Tax=unclassified Leptolyngbya TaxID=2650499 RepID=UPI0016847ADD|nr:MULTISPECIES: hypothetical protein [unclassified Leptolyngbya]MBD1909036.1 hypothetical protein [Leptolyngbya sp. FACHB-8]MBD2153028.1 hypothetical protein [Leptolyngbya sp. FACHB-16]